MILHELIERLDRIAKANGDEFGYRIDIESRGPLVAPKLTFVAYEKADGHIFVMSSHSVISVALLGAKEAITAALREWGYKEPEQ